MTNLESGTSLAARYLVREPSTRHQGRGVYDMYIYIYMYNYTLTLFVIDKEYSDKAAMNK